MPAYFYRSLIALFLIALVSGVKDASAQCTPDPTITSPGIYPDSATGFLPGIEGTPYSQIVQVRVPVDTMLGSLNVNITGTSLDSATGIPPGLTYTCNVPNCFFPGGGNGCVLISGVPTVPGTYNPTFYLTTYGTVFGVPVPPQNDVVDYYFIDVNQATGIAGQTPKVFEVYQNIPNPFKNKCQIKYYSPGIGSVELTVFNLIGKVVHRDVMNAKPGFNSFLFEAENLQAGIYMYTVSYGQFSYTKRMVISQ